LQPGDVILTGTPPGVGHARKPPEFMYTGDIMETHVAGVGTLRNRIGNADRR
jgi:2-keto-4-pentenoate hydratase/2-oxohepta-3-ene-1,7-dioic acid hydratase in catechol pathway